MGGLKNETIENIPKLSPQAKPRQERGRDLSNCNDQIAAHWGEEMNADDQYELDNYYDYFDGNSMKKADDHDLKMVRKLLEESLKGLLDGFAKLSDEKLLHFIQNNGRSLYLSAKTEPCKDHPKRSNSLDVYKIEVNLSRVRG